MAPSWRWSCLIAATYLPLFRAAISTQTPVRRHVSMNNLSLETPVSREYFYAGGRYVDDGSGTGQHVFQDQMYVERLSPTVDSPRPYPLVFIHGQGQSGTVRFSA